MKLSPKQQATIMLKVLRKQNEQLQAKLDKYRKRVSELEQECIEVETDVSNSYKEINRLKEKLDASPWILVSEGLPKVNAKYEVSNSKQKWEQWCIDGEWAWDHEGRGSDYRPITLPAEEEASDES